MYATVDDVQVRYGRALTPAESGQVEAWIGDVESEILERIPDLDALVSVGRPSFGTVRRVVCAAVERKLRNPGGLRTKTVAIDDYSTTETTDTTNSAGYLELTDDEWAKLLPSSASGSSAFTIVPG